MKFYYAPGTCALASHIALLEAGVKFDSARVDLKTKKAGNEDYLSINPKGYVPALLLDTQQLMTEGVAIIQWAADQAPNKNLLPAWGTPERYKAIEWLNYIATELHRGFGPLWNPANPEDVKQRARDNLNKRFGYVENQLQKTDFLMGSQFSLVDSYLFVMLEWCRLHKVDTSKWPKLMKLHENVKARPSTIEALKIEAQ